MELDSLPKLKDQQEINSITARFLFAANNKRQVFPQLIGIGGGPGAGKSFLYDHTETLIQRHDAVLKLLPDIISIADRYFIYENSNDESFPALKNSSIRSVRGASLGV